jgi:hypothetical protein
MRDTFQAEDVEISVTGAGRADVTATNSLKAAITGAGSGELRRKSKIG